MSEQVVAVDPVQTEPRVGSSASLDLLRRAAELGWIADFGKGQPVTKLTDDQEASRGILQEEPLARIDAASIRDLMMELAYAGPQGDEGNSSFPGGAALRLYNVTIVGVLELDDASGPGGAELPRLEFDRCWFTATKIRMARCRIKSLCLRSCAFAELQASEAVIGGPVELSYARGSGADANDPNKCWVVLAGAQIGARIHAGQSAFVAPIERKAKDWVLYSKHAIYALDLRSTKIRGSVNLRPNMSAIGGVCLTLAKVEGSIWANGACLEAREEWSFAADYAEVQGSLYFRPFDGPLKQGDEKGVPAARAKEFVSKGCMSLFAAKIGGSIYFQGAHLVARNGDVRWEETSVLNLSTCVINGHCLFRGWIPEPAKTDATGLALSSKVWHFVGDGEIHLSAAVIGNDLDFSGARVRRITADNMEVSGNCELGTYTNSKIKDPQPFVAWNGISLPGARIRGNLVMNGARIGCVEGEAALPLSGIERTCGLIDQDGRISSAKKRASVDPPPDGMTLPPGQPRTEEENGFLAVGLTVGGLCSMEAFEDSRGNNVFLFECAGRICLEDARIGGSFCMDGARVAHRKGTAVSLAGAQIGGKTSFRTKTAKHGSWAREGFRFSVWGGEIALKLNGAKMAFSLNMNGAYLEGTRLALAADNIDVGGRASLGTFEIKGLQDNHTPYRFTAKGKVSLVGATIKLQLDLSGARIERSKEPSRMREESGVMDALDMTLIHTKGIRLGKHCCLTDGATHVDREELANPDDSGCRVDQGGEDNQERFFTADGQVVLKHASIDTDLMIEGCVLSRQMTVEFAKVGGSVSLCEVDMRRKFTGEWSRLETSTSPAVPLSEPLAKKDYGQRRLVADISLKGTSVGGSLRIWDDKLKQMRTEEAAKAKIVVDLRGATIGELDDRGGQAWDENIRLWIEGFRYNRFTETGASSPGATFQLRSIVDPGCIPRLREDRRAWQHRAAWLQQQYFDGRRPRRGKWKNESTPDAYEQAIAKLKAAGSFEDAKRISSIHLHDNGQDSRLSRFLIWTPFRLLFNYGYSVERALLTFALCLVLGVAGAYKAANHGALVKMEKGIPRSVGDKLPGCGRRVDLVLYAIHVFIPVLDSKEEGACSIDPSRDGWLVAQEGYAALGWIITPLVILTASGLLKRHLER